MTTNTLLAGRYRPVRPLGGGGATEVWECLDEAFEHPVAVKMLPLRAGGRASTGRFREEARMVGQLDHPGIARVHDVGVHGATAFLVTEMLPGPGLDALLAERGPLPVEEAVERMDELLGALAAAHATGVVHRRLKPSNVVLDADGHLRLVDFGVATLYESGALSTTVDSEGTADARYLAPEQATGQGVDARTDVYAAGCIFMEMVTGRPPFVDGSAVEVADKHVHVDAARVAERRPEVPHRFDVTASKLLAKNPAERPVSAEEVRLMLRQGEAFAAGVVPGKADHVASQVHRGPSRRWSFLLPVYVVVALSLVVGVMAFLLTRGGMSF